MRFQPEGRPMSPYLWVALTVPAFFISAWLLAKSISSLVRLVRGSVVLSVPVTPVQSLRLEQAGPYQLGVEGNRFSRDFGDLDFELRSPHGDSMALPAILVRTSVNGLTRSRLTLRSFEADEPGNYQLTVRGIGPSQNADNRIVISRPIGGSMVGLILAIIATGALTLGSLVGTVLLLVLPGRASR